MKNKVIWIIFLLLLTVSPSFSQTKMTWGFSLDGYKYSYEITDKALRNTPSFDPEKEDVPLSIQQATEVARRNLKRFAPKANDNWDVLNVKLHKFGEKWLYEVEFYCFLSKCGNENDGMKLFVKLDGKIVKPVRKLNKNPKNLQPIL